MKKNIVKGHFAIIERKGMMAVIEAKKALLIEGPDDLTITDKTKSKLTDKEKSKL